MVCDNYARQDSDLRPSVSYPDDFHRRLLNVRGLDCIFAMPSWFRR
jgi:hypothetical protein